MNCKNGAGHVRMMISALVFALSFFSEPSAVAKKPDTVVVSGSYSVPIPSERPELIAVATFPTKYKIRFSQGVPAKISYDMPAELTGGPVDIEISPSTQNDRSSDSWGGANSNGSCVFEGGAVRCQMIYNQIPINKELAVQTIEQLYGDSPQRELAKQVLELFSNETIGVLKFSLLKE